jgi:hypothetical protein
VTACASLTASPSAASASLSREECLNVSWFQNLFDAWRKIAAWSLRPGMIAHFVQDAMGGLLARYLMH